jgi:hypothetical protein
MATTARGLPYAIAQGDWATAGVDLTLLGGALVLAWLARKVAVKGTVRAAPARVARVAP